MDAACLPYSPQEIQFFLLFGRDLPFCILGQNDRQIKHEIGHVQFRVLRNLRVGQNSLQLSSSTAAHSLRGLSFSRFQAGGVLSNFSELSSRTSRIAKESFSWTGLSFFALPFTCSGAYHDLGQHLALLSSSKPSATVDGFLARAAVPALHQRSSRFWHLPLPKTKQELNRFAIKAGQPSVAFFRIERAP